MRKTLLLTIACLCLSVGYGQSAKEMLAEIEGKWELDDNGNVTVVRVIESPGLTKDEVFNRALNYFTYNYASGKSVIQTQDKENGLIVGKGRYDNVHAGLTLTMITQVDAWHILRVDARDGRARIIVSLTDYEKITGAGSVSPMYTSSKISDQYPINPKKGSAAMMGKAFYKAFMRANNTLDAVGKAIKEGSTSKKIENSDW